MEAICGTRDHSHSFTPSLNRMHHKWPASVSRPSWDGLGCSPAIDGGYANKPTSFSPRSERNAAHGRTNKLRVSFAFTTILLVFLPASLLSSSTSTIVRLSPSSMNVYGEDLPRCYFHPKQVVVGICSLCLRERLLNLASTQGHKHPQAEDTRRSLVLKRKLTICLPRFYAVSSILHRLKFRHQRTNDGFDECSIPSQDSFISVNFVDDDPPAPHGQNKEGGSMEYVKQPGIPRWRKKIGRLFEFAKWKGSPKPGTCKERNQGGRVGQRALIRRRATSE